MVTTRARSAREVALRGWKGKQENKRIHIATKQESIYQSLAIVTLQPHIGAGGLSVTTMNEDVLANCLRGHQKDERVYNNIVRVGRVPMINLFKSTMRKGIGRLMMVGKRADQETRGVVHKYRYLLAGIVPSTSAIGYQDAELEEG